MKNFLNLLCVQLCLVLLFFARCRSPENPVLPSRHIFSLSGMSYDSLLPYSPYCSEILSHEGYTLCYSEEHEQAVWVAYVLSKSDLDGGAVRSDDFRVDSAVRDGSASSDDYAGSGYDRGHHKPANHSKASDEEMSASFLMSNITPQAPGFNRGFNLRVENCIGRWAAREESVFVVSGAILRKDLPRIGSDSVSVPYYFFKTVADLSGEGKMISFLMKNETCSLQIQSALVPTDSVESLSGIDMFMTLPDSIENEWEKRSEWELWE